MATYPNVKVIKRQKVVNAGITQYMVQLLGKGYVGGLAEWVRCTLYDTDGSILEDFPKAANFTVKIGSSVPNPKYSDVEVTQHSTEDVDSVTMYSVIMSKYAETESIIIDIADLDGSVHDEYILHNKFEVQFDQE